MNRIIFILFFFTTFVAYSQSEELRKVRDLYYQASLSSSATDELREKLKDQKLANDPVLYGYKGMSLLLQANHSSNPYKKIRYFSKGKDILEEAINYAPENAELRFLRFSVQTNAPGFLSYQSEIEQDKQILISYLTKEASQSDPDLYKRIKDYLLSSDKVKQEEKEIIKKLQ